MIRAKSIAADSAKFDPLELIPRAYSLSSLTDYTGLRGTGGAEFTKMDVQHALSAARLGTGDIGPELLQDYAFVRGGLPPVYRDQCVARIRENSGPIYFERSASAAALAAWQHFVIGGREPCDKTAKRLGVRYAVYLANVREADHYTSTALYRAIKRFKCAISKREVGDTELALWVADSETGVEVAA